MQKTTKITLGAGALAAVLALGAGIAVADGGQGGWSHRGQMGGQMGMMGGHDGMMGGRMGGGMGGPGDGMGMMMLMAVPVDFAAADANGDGALTEEELTAWRAAQVKTIDANGDGKLSAEEITAFQIALITPRIEERVTDMVAKLDTDGDKLVSAAELLARPLAGPSFDRLDRNNDGSVTEDELARPGGRGGKNAAPAAPTAPDAAPAPSGN